MIHIPAADASDTQQSTLMVDLLRAFYWFDEALQAQMAARGRPKVPRGQSLALINVALGVDRPARLARSLGVTRSAVSQILRDLVDRGLVTLSPDPTDKRGQIIRFSDSGHKDDARDIMNAIERQLAERLGREQAKTLSAALRMDWGKPPT